MIFLIKFVYASLILNLNLIFHENAATTKTRNLAEVTIIYQENLVLLMHSVINSAGIILILD